MIFSSPYPDVAIPDAPLTAFVLRHAERLADKPAMIDGTTGRTLTYGQLAEAIDRTAAGLSERGFRRGSVLAIYSPNCPEYAVAFHAAASLGGITTTVNPMFTSDELTYQLREAAADWLLTTPALMDTAREAAARTGVREIFVFGDTPGGTPGATPLGHLSPAAGAAPRVPIDASVDLVALPIFQRHDRAAEGGHAHARQPRGERRPDRRVRGRDRNGHADRRASVLSHLRSDRADELRAVDRGDGRDHARFELEPFLQIMEAHAVTYAYLAPPIVLALAKQPAVDRTICRGSGSSSRAAPRWAPRWHRLRQRLGCIVKQGYGLTEASPVTHLNPSDPDRVKAGTIGLLEPNTVAKVIDPESGAALGPEARGEVWLRGPQIMQGYVNRPDATAEMITPDGWLRTGDLGFVDLDGHFTIVDRLKELIKYKGYQVAPAELEALLLSHPAVADAAVIPSPDEAAGEVPKAFVVARGEVTANELMAFVAERVAPYKQVRRVAFVDQIPKSPSGKILRRILVERERADVLIPA